MEEREKILIKATILRSPTSNENFYRVKTKSGVAVWIRDEDICKKGDENEYHAEREEIQ